MNAAAPQKTRATIYGGLPVLVDMKSRRHIAGGEVVMVEWAEDSTDPKMIFADGTVHPAHRQGFKWDAPVCNLTFVEGVQ